MKYILIIISALIILVLIGYKYFASKAIDTQEEEFRQLAELDIQESPLYFPDSMKMSDKVFWKLIEDSKSSYPHSFDNQMNHLIRQLSKMSNDQIIGFERTLREKVIELWNYNVKALYQILYGNYFSTDLFIYFRFWIVSNGQEYFSTALKNPDNLSDKIAVNQDGESLMYVADNAFVIKNGQSTESELPRDQSMEVDYDFGVYKMTGEYIAPADFDDEFPRLTAKFK